METNILLENGTNELEVLEFTVAGSHYGINVAKVREIITYQNVTPVPNAHPSIEGIFMPRDIMITVINLARELGAKNHENTEDDMMIITNFNKLSIAFHVDEVVGIHRVSWADIIKPDNTINTSDMGVATGIIKIDKKLIIILDFEKIVADISPETSLKVSDIDQLGVRQRNESPILMAEDSALLSKLIIDSIHKSGYENVDACANGQEAWDKLAEWKEKGIVKDKVKCIITDIEMPIMDGHRLIKLCKEDDEIKDIPIIIFSSLVNEEMRRKGEALGADAQLSKPEIGSLVATIDSLLLKK
ncbi:chemotaxis protein [Lachnospiraceae bacterium HCP1S3_C3]